jgi:hypothetical protein
MTRVSGSNGLACCSNPTLPPEGCSLQDGPQIRNACISLFDSPIRIVSLEKILADLEVLRASTRSSLHLNRFRQIESCASRHTH